MRKQLPNILLIIVILINIYFMTLFIKNNGFGQFLNITGIIFLIIGVMIFIFFISIDPGYGWIDSIDLTKNYIMIFVSIAVGITGIVLIISGQQLDKLRIETLNKQLRCKDIKAGQASTVLKKEWFNLRDQKQATSLVTYLFQKKSNRNNYKIITTFQEQDSLQAIDSLVISSNLLTGPIKVEAYKSICPGVFEQDISIDYAKHQKVGEQVSFDLTIMLHEKWSSGEESPIRKKSIQFTLKNTSQVHTEPELGYFAKPLGYGNRLLPAYVN